ncbi:MAG: family 1 glycosylhydrolase [Eubacteriales bacterium]|nr:family 1 glycosylhydrolase [Eubacteriales bacterium]
MSFPEHFLWGAATAAYQVEGAGDEDGRSSCIWDVLAPGHVSHDETGLVACDHYHRFREDIRLMKLLGLKSYRFSVSWSRVMPEGTGEVNQKGLDFYIDLVRELRAAGIEPMVTLYHWDLPYALYLKGGWLNPESPEWFAQYTAVVVKALSPWVRYWMTINEPQCFIGISYKGAVHAPFLDEPTSLLPATRNVLLAHGRSVQVIRSLAALPPQIGLAPCGAVFEPVSESPADVEAARAETFEGSVGPSGVSWWCDPIFLGRANPAAAAQMGIDPGELFTPEQWQLVSQKLDFFGFNIYQAAGMPLADSPYTGNTACGSPITAMDWPITPNALYWAVRFLQERYRLPVLITENGMANTDFVMLGGAVHDPQRIDYTHRYLLGLRRAIDEGYRVLGYTYWSLFDNYEWTFGYSRRFGLIYVDYATQQRTLKDSAYWYADVIRTNGRNL